MDPVGVSWDLVGPSGHQYGHNADQFGSLWDQCVPRVRSVLAQCASVWAHADYDTPILNGPINVNIFAVL